MAHGTNGLNAARAASLEGALDKLGPIVAPRRGLRSTCDRCGKYAGGTFAAAGVFCSEACANLPPVVLGPQGLEGITGWTLSQRIRAGIATPAEIRMANAAADLLRACKLGLRALDGRVLLAEPAQQSERAGHALRTGRWAVDQATV